LFWAKTDHPSLDGVHVVQTAYSRHGNFGEFDGRCGSSLPGMTTTQKNAEEEEKSSFPAKAI